MNFTIAIPTYHRPDLVVRAIQSALSQTKAPYEILVHDNSDGSETERALVNFPKDLVRYRRHSKNIGITDNWNSLIEEARGDYIKFLNDDDQLSIDCLEVADHALEKQEAGVITCRANYVTVDGKLIKSDRCSSSGKSYFVPALYSSYLWLKGALPLRTPTHSFYRSDIAKKIGGFTSSQDYTRDVFFALQSAIAGGAIFIEHKPLASFLIHPGQDGKKIPFRVRVGDQQEVKRWASQYCAEQLIANELEVELNSILMREVLLMLKDRRWSDLLHGGLELLQKSKYLSATSLNLVKRELFTKEFNHKFEQYRVYYG